MFNRRKDPGPLEDPLVAPIEALLTLGAAPVGMRELQSRGRLPVPSAAWVCACISLDDAPTWLIYEAPAGRVEWCRVLGRVEPRSLVSARLLAGGHADPQDVLAWVRGDATDPWAGGDGWGDEGVVERLGEIIRG